MTIEVKVPLLPESITDATVSTWHKKVGDSVSRDETLVDLETDKVMLEVPAPVTGVIKEIFQASGAVVQAQTVLAIIEEGGATAKAEPKAEPKSEAKTESKTTAASAGPAARRAAAEHEVNVASLSGTGVGGRVTKENVLSSIKMSGGARPEERVPMTRIRARIAERLLEVKQNTAMLTTFNEVNMAPVMALRARYKDQFEKKYKVRLGFMSFFVKACLEALKRSPVVNASIDGNDIVYHGYYDIGVAVSTDRGLVVPVLRNVDKLSMAEIEAGIAQYAEKARTGKLSMEDMQGGNFTITNGGVFGSLLSTPILNAPQCAILGMHKIQERPVVENGEIVVRPMMYLALSYDHRLVDGKESVTFLVTIKELLEDPARLLLEI